MISGSWGPKHPGSTSPAPSVCRARNGVSCVAGLAGVPLLCPSRCPRLLREGATSHNGGLLMPLCVWNCVLQEQAQDFMRCLCICRIWGCKAASPPPGDSSFQCVLLKNRRQYFKGEGGSILNLWKNNDKETHWLPVQRVSAPWFYSAPTLCQALPRKQYLKLGQGGARPESDGFWNDLTHWIPEHKQEPVMP